jgi:hypothetical protein
MLVHEIVELYEGKKTKKAAPAPKPKGSMDEQIEKFKTGGGEIVGEIKKGSQTGFVGTHNKGKWNQVVIVFYPDGNYERFEKDSIVTYHEGWEGETVDTEHLSGKKRELTAYEIRVKEFEKNKKEYARKVAKERKERERLENKKAKKFGRDAEKAAKWLAAVDINDPDNSDIKKMLNKKGGVVDAMATVYKVICADTPGFDQETLETKLLTVLDHDYMERFGHITKTEKKDFQKLPTKWQRWAAAAVLV